MNSLSKIKWSCRRGMLELDLLLSSFVEQKYTRLSAQQQSDFVQLLTHSDPELHRWLLGFEQPESDTLTVIVQQIREHNKLNVLP